MQFNVSHHTRYDYSCPISLGAHRLRIIPKETAQQSLTRFSLQLNPLPATEQRTYDRYGNPLLCFEFNGISPLFEVRVELEALTKPSPSPPRDLLLPLNQELEATPYLGLIEQAHALDNLVQGAFAGAGQPLILFLQNLSNLLAVQLGPSCRIDGAPFLPSETLARGAASCRDLTWLFIAACRQVGIPARFVSGYHTRQLGRHPGALHAWPELLIPAHGWIGYDLDRDDWSDDSFLSVAAAPDPASVTPIEGEYSFVGSLLNSSLQVDVQIEAS